jgi:Tol biopolymer transport system component
MKKLLQSSIILFLFSASLLMVDISCKKQANAKVNAITNEGKIVYLSNEGKLWIMNNDGTDRHEIPVAIPSTHQVSNGPIAVSGDGTKIIFTLATNAVPTKFDLFTCNMDGADVTRILEDPSAIVSSFPFHDMVAF